jgi:cellulose synthase/poly-beta-1,6-N-acetylglucosamine synthase-like glycosyltransferase
VFFTELAWLYGFYNVWIIIFARLYCRQGKVNHLSGLRNHLENTPIALLYTTCNDFTEASAYSCVNQDYQVFTVYILDDSTDVRFKNQVDRFVERFPDKVCVIRRPNRRGFKAGNLNYALSKFAVTEPLFAIVDADEILPRNFLKHLVPILINDERCGFVQANHCCNPKASNLLRAVLGVGIDIHWRWYQPLRNKYGFVMLLGHGAVLRRDCWENIGGFPEIVSEDLAYAIRLRDAGWYGRFVQDITCYEEFPETVRSFRIRHMKWTRGTCELLITEVKRLMLSKNISIVEKIDVLIPVTNLPFSALFFLFAIATGVVFYNNLDVSSTAHAIEFGQISAFTSNPLNIAHSAFWDLDFLFITLLTFTAPMLCFILELCHRPLYLLRFLCSGFVLYAGLFPLSTIGVLTYVVTGRATFLVTGDRSIFSGRQSRFFATPVRQKIRGYFMSFLYRSHPDHSAVKSFEIACGLFLIFYGVFSFQISLIGLALTFLLLPVMHRAGWENPVIQRLILLPFSLIIVDLLVRSLTLFFLSG